MDSRNRSMIVSNSDYEIYRLKTVNLVVIIAGVGSICLSLVAIYKSTHVARAGVHAPLTETVEAKRFVVRYPDGSLAAEFGIMDEKPSPGLPALKLYDHGALRLEAAVMSHDGVRFTLNDVTGRDRLILFNQSSKDPGKHDSTELSLTSGEGRDVIGIEADRFGNGHISLFDADANARIQLGVIPKDEPPHIRPTITIFDTTGKEIVVIPPVAR
jgi:hypothetical protein